MKRQTVYPLHLASTRITARPARWLCSYAMLIGALLALLPGTLAADESSAAISVLFLGDNGPHQPRSRFDELQPVLADRGVSLDYTDDVADLNLTNLNRYDAMMVYANIDSIDDQYSDAILQYVQRGGGFVPLHCASYCFRNQPKLIALMGAQFKHHGTGVFQAKIEKPNHELMRGYTGFESWDETYVHHLHNDANRTILEYRVDENGREPWTWVRTHGKGRVFYTASGHDSRTWKNPSFQNLVERGIRWVVGDDPSTAGASSKARVSTDKDAFEVPKMTTMQERSGSFSYVDVGPKIPNYTPSKKWGVQGEPGTRMQKPLSPEQSLNRFVTPQGMSVELYADERDFESKPIAMTWDERGRLWICETLDYPNGLGGNRDRIRICEDTDGDQVADQFSVFADGLSIPTAIVIVRGGAVVQNATETIYLKDDDGDDVCDTRTTLITNWSLGDTHGGVSNFRYGLDNWIWAMQGYNTSTPKIDGKPSQTFRQGFFRFKLSQSDPPRVTDLEFIRSSNNNTWGLGISEEGLIFGSTANNNPSMFMPIPNRYYERVRGWAPSTLRPISDSSEFDPITPNVRQVDHHGKYTAGAGHALYTARAFPKQWWNRTAFVCGPTGHLIGTFVLRRSGAGYTSTSPINLLASDDQWTAPIMAEVGPDGAVWMIDWYNFIVQHNPTPNGFKKGKGAAYESDLRDKRHGRIYRVVPDSKASLHEFKSLQGASHLQLVETLKHPSMMWRLQAQRLLIESNAGTDPDAIQGLASLIRDTTVDEVGLNVGSIHAINTLSGFGEDVFRLVMGLGSIDSAADADNVDDERNRTTLIDAALRHPSAGVRRNAVAVLPHDRVGLMKLLQNSNLFHDDDAQVRLQSVLTLANMPESNKAGEMIASLSQMESDPIMVDALTSAAATHAMPFLLSTMANRQADSTARSAIAMRVAEHLARKGPDADALQQIVKSLPKADVEIATSILDGLSRGLPHEYSVSSNDSIDATIIDSFERCSPGTKVKLLRLASQIGTKALDAKAMSVFRSLEQDLANDDADTAIRISAARDLIAYQTSNIGPVEKVLSAITPQSSPDLAIALLNTLQNSQSDDAGKLLVVSMQRFSPSVKSSAINVVLGKPSWVKSLLNAAESKRFDTDELSLEQKQALSSFPDRSFRQQARRVLSMGGGLPDANREQVLQSLMHLTKRSGNAEAGQEVFKRVCANCHQHGNLGKPIGPNLTGMAVHPKEELLTHIIDPSRNVEGNFRLYNVLTVDGRIFSGMLAGESRTSITMIDSQAKETNIQREDIEQFVSSRKSVMPEGFEKQIDENQLVDLLEFLTDQGPFIPLSIDKHATAISTKGLFHQGDRGPDRMVFQNWKPKVFRGIPFVLTDPKGKSKANIILLHGPNGTLPPEMPRSVVLPVETTAKAIHLLSGVGGWNHPFSEKNSVSMIVRLQYHDGKQEDHKLLNGVHFADYIRRVDVPGSEFAFSLGNQQIRFLSVSPKREQTIDSIELVKGDDSSAPIVMAVTVERLSKTAK